MFGSRLYRRLVGLMPEDLRSEYGAEMCRVAEERWAEVRSQLGPLGALRFWLRQYAALIGAAVRVRRPDHDARDAGALDGFLLDLRQASRAVARRPGFALVTVLTLALGIGAATAIFSAVDTVLLRPLGYTESERVVVLFRTNAESGEREQGVSAANMRDFREAAVLFEAVGVADPWSFDMQVEGRTVALRGWMVSRGFFDAIGGEPLLGRTFTEADYDVGDAASIVVLSHGSWLNRFGADPDIVGKSVTMNGLSATVVGVLAPDFRFPDGSEVWSPRIEQPGDEQSRPAAYMTGVARLVDGVSLADARAEATSIARALEEGHPAVNADLAWDVVPLREHLLGDVRAALWVMMGAVGVLLLIACANVAGLMLARGAQRERDYALRGALGARPSRLTAYVCAESLVLAALGCALGIALTYAGVEMIRSFAPEEVPRIGEIGVDGRVLAFAVLAAALSAVLAALVPSLHLSRPDLKSALGDGARGTTGGRARASARAQLVVAQVAAAVVLLVGAGLLVRSFVVILDRDLGFDPENRLAVQLFAYDYEDNGDARAFVRDVVTNIEALPGVEGVALTTSLPASNDAAISNIDVILPFRIDGRPPVTPGQEPVTSLIQVGPRYFDLMSTSVLRGRDFAESDDLSTTRVAIVNETFARRHFGTADPVGERIVLTPASANAVPREVVGVVQDARPLGHASEPRPEVYLPLAQSWSGSLTFVVKATTDAAALTLPVTEAIWEANPAQAVWGTSTVEGLLGEWLEERRFTLVLLSAFSAVALLLAAIGLYGLVSFSVERRVGELGIRRALGGRGADLLGMILLEGAKLAGAGLLIGLGAAWYLSRFIRGLLFEVEPTDPLTLGLLASLVLATTLLATALPAIRALRVDPVQALRSE